MSDWHFIEPLDVLFLRGNRLFGDPGSYGESLVPPWPSAAAGAIRSALLAHGKTDPAAFARGKIEHPQLGTPDRPGAFRVLAFHPARERDGRIKGIYPIPADLAVSRDATGKLLVKRLLPREVGNSIRSSSPTEKLPVLAQSERGKPASGYWLTEAGWKDYLNGRTPAPERLVETAALWQMDERVGVGLEAARRRAGDGRLFTVQAVAPKPGVGFLAATEGAELPDRTTLRLGGDGRGASMRPAEGYRAPTTAPEELLAARRCRILLTTPGLFEGGWRPPGMAEDGRFELGGVRGRVVAAAVPRAETVSGWDLARWRPKPALRAAPTGSVYWIEELKATPEALGKLAGHGLWTESGYDAVRRVEGFNRFTWAVS